MPRAPRKPRPLTLKCRTMPESDTMEVWGEDHLSGLRRAYLKVSTVRNSGQWLDMALDTADLRRLSAYCLKLAAYLDHQKGTTR